jgi:lipopolysaccharide biosynthesis protein
VERTEHLKNFKIKQKIEKQEHAPEYFHDYWKEIAKMKEIYIVKIFISKLEWKFI